MTTNNVHLIPMNGEVRGKLVYESLTTGNLFTREGNFQLHTDGVHVVARKLNGRNRFLFVSVHQVFDFIPTEKKGK